MAVVLSIIAVVLAGLALGIIFIQSQVEKIKPKAAAQEDLARAESDLKTLALKVELALHIKGAAATDTAATAAKTA